MIQKPHSRRGCRHWTPAEDRILCELAGDMPTALLPRHYNTTAVSAGFQRRSMSAIQARAVDLGVSLRCVGNWLNLSDIARITGRDITTVSAWFRRYPAHGQQRFGKILWIRRPELRAWVRQHPNLMGGIKRMDLICLLEDEKLADELIEQFPRKARSPRQIKTIDGRIFPSVRAAAKAIHCTPDAIYKALWQGRTAVGGVQFEVIA